MPSQVDKNLLKSRFKKSLKTYNQEASVQRAMALALIKAVKNHTKLELKSVFEIGCGTGFLTEQILSSLNPEELFINDIVEECGNYITGDMRVRFLAGDAEIINFPNNLDLIISNASFQWFTNYKAVLDKAYSSLNKNGILAFSTFTPDNLKEIREITGHSIDYQLNGVDFGKFIPLYEYSESIKLYFDTPMDVLKHLKRTGVNSLTAKSWTKKDLRKLLIVLR
jgi:malonyl-ACP O-methyltransferase BioC